MTPNKAIANRAATTPMAMTVACGTNGDGDPATFADNDEAVLRPPETFGVAVDDAAADDDVDGEELFVGAALLDAVVVAIVLADGGDVIL